MKRSLLKYYDKRFLPVCYKFGNEVFLMDNFLRLGDIMVNPEIDIETVNLADLDFELLIFNQFGVRGANINGLTIDNRKTLIEYLTNRL